MAESNVGVGSLWVSIVSIDGEGAPYTAPVKSPLKITAVYLATEGLKSFDILLDGAVVQSEKIPVTSTVFSVKTGLKGSHTVGVNVVDRNGAVASDSATITIS